MTARDFDTNGFMEIKGNPLSKVGVFDYLGSSIGLPGLDKNKIYKVYRPESALSDSNCINSFKLLPWIDEHEMLGESFTAPEDKGVDGVTGEDIYFEDGYLKGNIKLFSESMANDIESGKRELSCGYRCKYELAVGEFEGQRYDVIQTDIRGNHLALVPEGRMGKEVAVLDKSDGIALDHYNITQNSNEDFQMPKSALEEKMDLILTGQDSINKRLDAMDEAEEEKKKAEDEEAEAKKKAEDEEAEAKKKAEDEEEEKKKDEDEEEETAYKLAAQDAKIADLESKLKDQSENGVKNFLKDQASKNELVENISQHVGAFDHAEKSLEEVAQYGIDKLEIECEKGSEIAVLKGFFHNRPKVSENAFSMDRKDKGGEGNQVSAYLGKS